MPGKPSFIPTAAQLRRAKAEGWEAWIQSSQDEIALARGCYFDTAAALATRNLFHNVLTHGKAPFDGKPFELLDWQWHGIIGPIYGWKMADGTRRYQSAFVFIPKKNGKTQLAAGIAIRELYEQVGARVFLAATARSQAGDCFDEAAGMVERSETLSENIEVRKSTGRLILPNRNASVATMTVSKGSSQGKNASCLIMDELHEWKDRGFFGSLLYADTARVNSLVFMITTAGDDLTSICYEEYTRAKRIIEGKDQTFDHLCQIYEAPADAKIDDLAAWKHANPSYGITLPVRKIERAIEQAQGSPQRVGDLKRYRLNLWTQPRSAWLDVKLWDALPQVTAEELSGVHCYGGLDLARVYDFAAFARVFESPGGGIDLLFRLWIPEDVVAEKSRSDQIPLQDWIDRGFVMTTPGDSIDYGELRRQIVADHAATPMEELGFDPHNAELLANQQLGAEDGVCVVAVPQTMTHMSPPSTEFERLIAAGKVRHDHNPALSWMISNVIVYKNSNDQIRPMKGRSKGRIDGVIAALIAINRQMGGGEDPKPTFYDDRSIEFV